MGYKIVASEFFQSLGDEDDEEDSKSEDNEDTQAIPVQPTASSMPQSDFSLNSSLSF